MDSVDEPGSPTPAHRPSAPERTFDVLRRPDIFTCYRQWRSVPAELGPWSRAAQTFIRWARLGVWERLLGLAQERGVELGMTFLDGTNIRAPQKAAGARRKGALKLSETPVRRLGDLVGAMAPRPA
jgi:hypothetical protein